MHTRIHYLLVYEYTIHENSIHELSSEPVLIFRKAKGGSGGGAQSKQGADVWPEQ